MHTNALANEGGVRETGPMPLQLVLVHSPLLGPESWASVGNELGFRNWAVVIPDLEDGGASSYWRQHVQSVGRQLAPNREPSVLIGHSGAGPLLAAIANDLGEGAAALVFVDAGLPADESSRLEMLRSEAGGRFADEFEAHLKSGGRYPEWSDLDLAALVPGAELRAAIIESMRPRAMDFWSEPLSAPAGWMERPCAYLQLSPGYAQPARKARTLGWPVIERAANHFALVTGPAEVAGDIEALLGELGIGPEG